jgi:broad specificity phosphatase PhoE
MKRCRQTCEILFSDTRYEYDDNLREIDFGFWEGLTFAEIARRDPALVEKWAEWSLDFCFPEGESIGHFVDRVKKIGQYIGRLPDKKILLVCHGGVARALLCHYLGLDVEKYLLFQLEKGKYSSVDLYGDLGVLTGVNLG